MPERDRKIIVGFGCLILVLAGAALWHVSSYNQNQSQQRTAAATYEMADSGSISKCAELTTGFDRAACLVEKIQASEEQQRARADLHAQHDMATWAVALLWVGLLGLVTSAAGIILIYVTLHETRQMTVATRSLGEKSTKAYVSVESCKILWPHEEESRTKTILSFKNSGQTPALNMKVALFENHKHEAIPHWARAKDKYPFGAVPGGEERPFEFTLSGSAFEDMLFDWEVGMSIGPSVSGAVFYEDIYGRLYRSGFSFLFECVAAGKDDPRKVSTNLVLPHFGVNSDLFEEAPEEHQPQKETR